MALGRPAGDSPPARRRPQPPARPVGRSAGRGPFAVLVVLILAGGLVALLLLNTALNQGSFQLTRLQKQTTSLTDQRQGLQQQIDGWSAPDALSVRARGLGMVPGGDPAFLRDDGTVLGRPQRLEPGAVPSVAQPTAAATPTPTATPGPTVAPSTRAPAGAANGGTGATTSSSNAH